MRENCENTADKFFPLKNVVNMIFFVAQDILKIAIIFIIIFNLCVYVYYSCK